MSHPDTLDPDLAYIGAVLALPAGEAVRAVGLIEPGDLDNPQLRVVHALTRDLAAAGIAPGPVAVLGEARRTGAVRGEHRTRALGDLLITAVEACPAPISVGYLAGLVLDAALRRRCQQAATRIAQAAQSSSVPDLLDLVHAETRAVGAVRQRRAVTLARLTAGASRASCPEVNAA